MHSAAHMVPMHSKPHCLVELVVQSVEQDKITVGSYSSLESIPILFHHIMTRPVVPNCFNALMRSSQRQRDLKKALLIRQRMLKPRGSEMQRLQCSKMRPTKFAQAVFHSHTRCVAMAPQGLAHPRGGRRPKWPQTNHSVHVMPCVGYTIYTGEKRKRQNAKFVKRSPTKLEVIGLLPRASRKVF